MLHIDIVFTRHKESTAEHNIQKHNIILYVESALFSRYGKTVRRFSLERKMLLCVVSGRQYRKGENMTRSRGNKLIYLFYFLFVERGRNVLNTPSRSERFPGLEIICGARMSGLSDPFRPPTLGLYEKENTTRVAGQNINYDPGRARVRRMIRDGRRHRESRKTLHDPSAFGWDFSE